MLIGYGCNKNHTGIYSDPACNGSINHGVLVVGYGTENGRLVS